MVMLAISNRHKLRRSTTLVNVLKRARCMDALPVKNRKLTTSKAEPTIVVKMWLVQIRMTVSLRIVGALAQKVKFLTNHSND
jgi:hypothetical protein